MEFDPKNYQYGIPTRFDVQDPQYQRLVKLEQIEQEIDPRSANFPVYGSSIIEHVHEALVTSNQLRDYSFPLVFEPAMVALNPGPIYFLPAKFSNLKHRLNGQPTFEDFIDPQKLVDLQLEKLQEYKSKLVTADPFVDEYKEVKEVSMTAVDPAVVKLLGVENLGLDPESKMYINDQEIPMYKFRYIPWEVLHSLVQSYGLELQGSIQIPGNNRRKLKNFESVVSRYNHLAHNEVNQFIRSVRNPFDSPWKFDSDENHEAGRLKLLNQQIVGQSDISLDFYAQRVKFGFFNPGNQAQFNEFNFETLLKSDRLDKYADEAFKTRREVRDLINEGLHQKGQLVFNGVPIRQSESNFMAEKSLPQWVINIISAPVLLGDETLEPDSWVKQEAELVQNYRTLSPDQMLQVPLHPAVRQIVKLYPSFGQARKAVDESAIANYVKYAMTTPPGLTGWASPKMPQFLPI